MYWGGPLEEYEYCLEELSSDALGRKERIEKIADIMAFSRQKDMREILPTSGN